MTREASRQGSSPQCLVTPLTNPTHRVARGGTLILGGGYAGAYVTRQLRPAIKPLIVNPTNFILLHAAAARGRRRRGIEPRHVAVPLRTMCPHADLLLGGSAVDARPRAPAPSPSSPTPEPFTVAYRRPDPSRSAPSPGCPPWTKALADHALGVKDISDAIRLRNHVLHQIELADADPDSRDGADVRRRRRRLRRRRDDLRAARPRRGRPPPDPRLARIARAGCSSTPRRGSSGSCPSACPVGRRGARRARHPGAVGHRLRSVDAGGAELSDGRRIEAETVVWTAGVSANPVIRELGLPVDERGRIPVDETLRVRGVPRVWALGDGAAVPNEATPGALDPATCQHALRQARRLAGNLSGAPRPYRYRCAARWPRSGAGAASSRSARSASAGARLAARPGYHLAQMPMAARRRRVAPTGSRGRCFRRDVAALTSRRGWALMGRHPELKLFAGAYLLYNAGRWLTAGDMGPAVANAQWIVRTEETLGLAVERSPLSQAPGQPDDVGAEPPLPRGPVPRAPRRAGLPLPPRAEDLPAAARHRARDLAPLDPGLRGVPRRPATARRGWASPTRSAPTAPSSLDRALRSIFYNELAAVPSLHCGFAVAVGIALAAASASRRSRRRSPCCGARSCV